MAESLSQRCYKRSREMFNTHVKSSAEGTSSSFLAPDFPPAQRVRVAAKISSGYGRVRDLEAGSVVPLVGGGGGASLRKEAEEEAVVVNENSLIGDIADDIQEEKTLEMERNMTTSIIPHMPPPSSSSGVNSSSSSALAIARREPPKVPRPTWHAPWRLTSVVSGHLGWVRAVAFDPSNEWFVTGAADRMIKVWDLAKCTAGEEGGLKLTLTGHINCIRGLAVSPRHPYLFSCGEDKKVLCWDLEQNKVIRSYHGHLSGVFCLGLHPTLDVLVTGGRDSVARVWDMRTKNQVHCLGGHDHTVFSLVTNPTDPQIITGSGDNTVKLWDLAAGKCMTTLTHHKKAVRSLVSHPREFSFVSGAADNMKKWYSKDGRFINNLPGHKAIINAMAVNEDGVLLSGGDNGSLRMWDWETGYCFQEAETTVQPGSLDAEAGIYAMSFDVTGTRLVTCEADKSIKIWKEDAEATEDTEPIEMKSWTRQCLTAKRF